MAEQQTKTKFSYVPLYVGRQTVDSTGRTPEVSFNMPDNIGTFVVRAFAVDSTNRFSSAEGEVIYRPKIGMEVRTLFCV